MRLAQALIFVKDLPVMAAFYRDVLGLSPILQDPPPSQTWMAFHAGAGASVALHAIPADIAATMEIASPPQPRTENPVKLIFEADDLAAEQLRLSALGVTVVPRPWGVLDGIDPEGNVFQITRSCIAAAS